MMALEKSDQASDTRTWHAYGKIWKKMPYGIALAAAFLSGCGNRPYSCQNATYPPAFKSVEEGWTHVATICETRIHADLLNWRDGVLLTVIVRTTTDEVISERELFFSGEERLFLDASWEDETSLIVKASSGLIRSESALIAEIYVNLSGP